MAAPATPVTAEAALSERPPPPRRCGRCLLAFPGDDTLDVVAQGAWWLCPPCSDALLGEGFVRAAH
jgi:hypothetical protein